MPRIHTAAGIWYSGVPTFRPMRSFASEMPQPAFTKIQEWRNIRDGKTGMAMNGRAGVNSETTYEESDISATSNSWWRSMRKNASSTGRLK